MVHCGTTIVKQEGAGALYKGLTPFVTHLTLKYALRFGSYAFFQKSMGASTHSEPSKQSTLDSLKPFLVRGVALCRLWLRLSPFGFRSDASLLLAHFFFWSPVALT
jgi:hypothetical protein